MPLSTLAFTPTPEEVTALLEEAADFVNCELGFSVPLTEELLFNMLFKNDYWGTPDLGDKLILILGSKATGSFIGLLTRMPFEPSVEMATPLQFDPSTSMEQITAGLLGVYTHRLFPHHPITVLIASYCPPDSSPARIGANVLACKMSQSQIYQHVAVAVSS